MAPFGFIFVDTYEIHSSIIQLLASADNISEKKFLYVEKKSYFR